MDRNGLRRGSAAALHRGLETLGVTHVVGVPDNASAALYRRLAEGSAIRLIRVAREGEAFAVAAGLWVGGSTPVVVVQNTGLLESGDSLRGTVVRMGVPLLSIVTYRGFAKMEALTPAERTAEDALVRADADSVALLTEPTLEAWRIPFVFYRADADGAVLSRAFARAQERQGPIAVLVPYSLD